MSALTDMQSTAIAGIIARMRAVADAHYEAVLKVPMAPDLASQTAKAFELRYAMISLVESAIADGLKPVDALLWARDTGVMLWGMKIYHQHSGAGCMRCLEASAGDIGLLLMEAAGVPGSVSTSSSTGTPPGHADGTPQFTRH